MITIISPAKTLDFKQTDWTEPTEPQFIEQASQLVTILKKKSVPDLQSLMSLSEKLATLNKERYENWLTDHRQNAAPCGLAFQGDVYKGMRATDWPQKTQTYAQDHLRILSGLYGVLRPGDKIHAYRLEMGTDLENEKGKNLYEFWGKTITDALNKDAKNSQSKYILNLASNEYWKSVNTKALQIPVISPVFKDCKNGKYKIISFYAKKARGLMAQFVLKNQITDLKEIEKFDLEGYRFVKEESQEKAPVFYREEQ